MHRPATQTNDLASTANDLTQTFSYNPASQISSVTRSNDLYAWTGHFNQNDSSTPNGLNQIGNVEAKTITHDGRGNITAVGTDAYAYSSENFLTAGPGSGALAYDPMGRLYQVTNAATTTRMGYDGLDRIAEYDGGNAVLRRYIHGPGIDEPIAWYEGSGTTTRRFLSSDERGSIISVTDGAGALLGINKYDEYGVPQSTNLGRFGYTGQTWVPEVGLWYYKARFYRADIGRFMQTDPIGYGAGLNLYFYVRNDPINWIDPLGLTSLPNADGGGGVCSSDMPECPPITVTTPLITGNLGALLRSGQRPGGGGGGGGEPRSDEEAQCQSPPITREEREAAERGDRWAFWRSRAARGDPLAQTALNILRNEGLQAQWANSKVIGAIRYTYGAIPTDTIRSMIRNIGVDLMRAHVRAIDKFGGANAEVIARYHFGVFAQYGLPPSTFAGGANGGRAKFSDQHFNWSGCQ